MGRLTKAAESIGETLDEAMGKLAQKVCLFFKIYIYHYESNVIIQIEVSLAVLWEGARDNPTQLRARKEITDLVQIVREQIQVWTQADKIKQNMAKFAATDNMDVDQDWLVLQWIFYSSH